MFKSIPKKVRLAILLIEALDIPLAIKLAQTIVYMWREFGVKVSIKPIVKNFIVNFHYKDSCLLSYGTKNINDIIEISEEIKRSRVPEQIKLLEDKQKKNNDR